MTATPNGTVTRLPSARASCIPVSKYSFVFEQGRKSRKAVLPRRHPGPSHCIVRAEIGDQPVPSRPLCLIHSPHFRTSSAEALAVLGDVFEDDLVEQHGDGVEVAGEGVGAHTQGFERDGAAAGERVHDERPGAGRAAERLHARPG